MSISSLYSTNNIESDGSFSFIINDTEVSQRVFVNNEAGDIVYLGYINPENESFEIGAESTCISLLMMSGWNLALCVKLESEMIYLFISNEIFSDVVELINSTIDTYGKLFPNESIMLQISNFFSKDFLIMEQVSFL